MQGNQTFLIQVAHSFLKGFLADTKRIINIFRRAFIIQVDSSSMRFDIVEQRFRKIVNLFKTGFLKNQVYLTIFTHLFHKSFHLHPCFQRAEYFIFIQQTTILIIYNRFKAQIRLLPDKDIHFCFRSIFRFFFRQITFHLCWSHNTITLFIQMCMNHIFPPNLHFHLLLTEWNEQVFHQSPVQESSILIHPGYFQTGKLT